VLKRKAFDLPTTHFKATVLQLKRGVSDSQTKYLKYFSMSNKLKLDSKH